MTTETIDDYGYNSKTGEYQLFPLLARIAPNVADKIRDFFVWSNIPLNPSTLACKGESVCLELLDCHEPVKRRRRLRRKHG